MTIRIEISGTFEAQSPLHIGGHAKGDIVDAPLVTDGLGRYLIPGTSLAGLLRSKVDSEGGAWGSAGDTDQDAWPSKVTVFDAYETEKQHQLSEKPSGTASKHVASFVQDHVSIDSKYGVAKKTALYSMEYLPSGTTFRVRIVLSGEDHEKTELKALAYSLVGLMKDGVSVGAKTTNGNGLVKLVDEDIRIADFSAASIIAALTGGESLPIAPDDIAREANLEQHGCQISFTLTPVEPLYSAIEISGSVFDSIPFVMPIATNDGEKIRIAVPGSSIKGTLRHHAERIERTAKLNFADNSSDACEVAMSLFGYIDAECQAEGRTSPAAKGAVTVGSLLSEAEISRTKWDAIVDAENDTAAMRKIVEFNKEFNEAIRRDRVFLKLQSRNAIDRFSGAVVDGALFTALEVTCNFQPLVIDIDVFELAKRCDFNSEKVAAALTLLLLVLRDLEEGMIRFGTSTNRGFGSFRVGDGSGASQIEIRPLTGGAEQTSAECEAGWSQIAEILSSICASGNLQTVLSNHKLSSELSVQWQNTISHRAATANVSEH